MNRYEIFQKVKTHLLQQNARSFGTDEGSCLYKSPDGKKCAVGCLISPEFYSTKLEYMTVSSPIILEAVENSIGRELDEKDEHLLHKLQSLHDLQVPEDWPGLLENLENDLASEGYFNEHA